MSRLQQLHKLNCAKRTAEKGPDMPIKPNPERLDQESPELTEEWFAKARPASEMLPGLFGEAAAKAMLKPKRGRPVFAIPKSNTILDRMLPEFDAAPYLDSEDAVSAYLTDILGSGDSNLLAVALEDIARARGMTEIANAPGMTREAWSAALTADKPEQSPE